MFTIIKKSFIVSREYQRFFMHITMYLEISALISFVGFIQEIQVKTETENRKKYCLKFKVLLPLNL
jgi:hypothetical protein